MNARPRLTACGTLSGARKALAAVLSVATLCAVAACRRQATAPPVETPDQLASVLVDPAGVAFGYADSTGSKLLMLRGDNVAMEAAQAKSMEAAVCGEGRELQLRYLRFQERSAADNGRQSTGNFDNDEGHLYEIAGARAEPGETCLLVPSGYLQRFPIVPNDIPALERARRLDTYSRHRREADTGGQPFDATPFQPVDDLANETVARIQREKGRAVTLYWPLHRASVSQQVAAVELVAVGDSLLGGVVLAEPGRLSFFDMPASLAEGRANGGCWRVDDECRFDAAGMNVPAVLGAPGERLIFFTSGGPEGQAIALFQAAGGKLVEVRRTYRYHAPM